MVMGRPAAGGVCQVGQGGEDPWRQRPEAQPGSKSREEASGGSPRGKSLVCGVSKRSAVTPVPCSEIILMELKRWRRTY